MQENKKVTLLRPVPDGTEERLTKLTLLHPACDGINAPQYAYAEGAGYGWFKCCAATDRDMEELEVWLAFLGSRLGVHMAETWLVLAGNGTKLGCFSRDVAGADGTFVTADESKVRWAAMAQPPRWAVEAAAIYAAAPKAEPLPDHRLSIVNDPETLKKLLVFVYGVLSRDGQYDVSASFADMVLLDCLVGQKDRNMNGIGLVFRPDGRAEMAALFDNASILLPGLEESAVGFCNILTDGALLAQCTAELFPQQTRNFARRLQRFAQQEQAAFLQRQNTFLPDSYRRRMERRMDAWCSLPPFSELWKI